MSDIVDIANERAELALHAALTCAMPAPANDVAACVDCDEPIPRARKAAVPWAVRCIDCQAEYEQHQGHEQHQSSVAR